MLILIQMVYTQIFQDFSSIDFGGYGEWQRRGKAVSVILQKGWQFGLSSLS